MAPSRPFTGKVTIGYAMVSRVLLVIVMVVLARRSPMRSGWPYVMVVAVMLSGVLGCAATAAPAVPVRSSGPSVGPSPGGS